MATYVIGDVHGCYRTLQALLEQIEWRPMGDRLIFTGDLINGPDSLGVLRWARDNDVESVLGNHDIHFLGVINGVRRVRRSDSFSDLLEAPDCGELADWLRTRPMFIRMENAAVVHAGLLPAWTLDAAERLAREVEDSLSGEGIGAFLGDLFRNDPEFWSDGLPRADRLRIAVNAMTRMRVVSPKGGIDLTYKGRPPGRAEGPVPWFEAPRAWDSGVEIFFGHWAALGFYQGNGVVGLDSGCVWGNELTAFRLEDRAVFREESERMR